MSKHASEMTLEEMKPVLIANGLFGAQRLLRELKAHQSNQDAEIERLNDQLDGVLAAVEGANRYRPVVMSARGAMISVEDGAWIDRAGIKDRILAAKGEA